MKKKLAILLIAVLSVFSLAACSGGGSEEEAVRGVATSFLDAMQAGDFVTASNYCTENALEGADVEQLANLDQMFYSELGIDESMLSDDAKKSLSDFIDSILGNFMNSYEITDVKIDGETATVNANITYGFDPNAISSINIDDELTTLSQDYLTEHQDELVEIYTSQGEEAMTLKVINDIMPDILSMYTNAILATGEVDDTLQMTLIKQEDGSWIIDDAVISAVAE